MESTIAIILGIIAIVGFVLNLIVIVWRAAKENQKHDNDVANVKTEVAILKENLVGTIKMIETKHEAEVKRNDDIISLINGEAKSTATDQKEVVKRLTIMETEQRTMLRDFETLWPRLSVVEKDCVKTQTICEHCTGRGFGCGEEDEKNKP